MRTYVYMLDVSLPGLEVSQKLEYLERILPELSEYRREKVRQTRFLEDKLCSAGAGLLLTMGLNAYGLSGREEQIGFCGNQKPYLVNHPEIRFNLSHSGSMVLAVFSECEVGCDIEKNGKPDYRIARRFFHQEEQADLDQFSDADEKADRFYRYWTLKESFLKVTAEGMRLAMNRFCIRLGQPEAEAEQFEAEAERLEAEAKQFEAASEQFKAASEQIVERGADFGKDTITVDLDDVRQPHVFKEWQLPGYHAALCVKGNPGDVFFSFQKIQDVV